MAALSPWQIFTVGAIGGMAGFVGLVLAVLLGLGLYAAVARLYDALAAHCEQRRALRDGRRRLASVTTPDDLKDRP
ncbi:hypothetical protein ABZX56_11035 [Streptomyces parvulus]|uniref:hypothetical protein n=1 Tax=Streptomyces parvulus TaxID=146923 RepID=UPI0033B4D2CE